MNEIKRTLKLDAAAETVYAWLTDPDHLQKWFSDHAEKTGDTYSFKWNMQDGGSTGFEVTVVSDDAPHTFVYKANDGSDIQTRFDVASDGENTIVALVESGFSDDDAGEALRQEHEGGWDWFFSRLKELDS
mgnify:CR=1 FL=1